MFTKGTLSIAPKKQYTFQSSMATMDKFLVARPDKQLYFYTRVVWKDLLLNRRDSIRQLFKYRGKGIDGNQFKIAVIRDKEKVSNYIRQNNLGKTQKIISQNIVFA